MDKKLSTWVDVPENCDFSIYNLPFGIYSKKENRKVGVAIGNELIDLGMALETGVFDHLNIKPEVFSNDSLNDFISLGKEITNSVRSILQAELCDEDSVLRTKSKLMHALPEVTMHLPIRIGDYTDFYSSIEHATNVGKMFRDPENALLPNWKHIPVGYHGRASSIIPSGQPIHRPLGQLKPAEGPPVHRPTERLDFELEMGFIVGKSTQLGETISTANAEEHIFGMVLFNDWSARDVQKWEYVPLGPFMAKNFASSMSPWVVTMEALQPFKVAGPKQAPEVLPYLAYEGDRNFDISLSVEITASGENVPTVVSRSNFKYMYWNMVQQLAHHTMNGCNVNIGDLMASGTISGPEEGSFGSMLELTWSGSQPLTLHSGETRKFIEDGDVVTMKGFGSRDNVRVGFGEVSCEVLPSK